MGEATWWSSLKEIVVGKIAWRMFLWSISLSEQEYWDKVYFEEWERRNGERP